MSTPRLSGGGAAHGVEELYVISAGANAEPGSAMGELVQQAAADGNDEVRPSAPILLRFLAQRSMNVIGNRSGAVGAERYGPTSNHQ
jgi:hypothetical protein